MMENSINAEVQQHPISTYFKVWGLLFVLSTFSYMVDYMAFEGALRWTLLLIFMFLKAGLTIAVFMHMMWDRMAFWLAILLRALGLCVFILRLAIESRSPYSSVLSLCRTQYT